ncbi:hypothetical protein Q4S45_12925 [Massilia sp. R2A-15]|uniref:hypothetical protein n=1 Tax=Massilia sp. R2A-15 TaxID=3064278 RepID=UPI0027348E07|nr:hypothetical protein [Massilia sp. R2A-15]WLI87644.1 hypothetical protein Q4S45_12925 [Massilia sp. R2A-15]
MKITDAVGRRFLALSFCMAAWLPMPGQAAAQPASIGQTFSLDQTHDFSNYKSVVRKYIQKQRPHAAEDVCVLGLIADDRSKFAWVLWEQGGELILYEDGETDLSLSRRRLNLKKDVVASESDLRGSTYLITKDRLEQIRNACHQHGAQLHITPRSPGRGVSPARAKH